MMDSVVEKEATEYSASEELREFHTYVHPCKVGQAWIRAAGEALPFICSASLQSFRKFWTKKIGEISRFMVTYANTNMEN